MFINPENPRSAYSMAYNSVATGDNSATFNDGYHILHHLNSMTHWSELPVQFLKSLDRHIENKGLRMFLHCIPSCSCRSPQHCTKALPVDVQRTWSCAAGLRWDRQRCPAASTIVKSRKLHVCSSCGWR